jgi:hypothetical protein
VTGEDVALELIHVGVPELGGLTVEGRCAARGVSGCFSLDNQEGLLVGFAEQALQRQQDGTDVQDSTPLVLENVEADAALHVDIGVVDGSGEADLRRHVWVAGREVEAQLECESRVGRVGGTDDGAVPDSEVAVMRKGTDAGRRRCHQCHELTLQSVIRVSVDGCAYSNKVTNRLMTLPLSLDLEGLVGAFEAAATVAMLVVSAGRDSTTLG